MWNYLFSLQKEEWKGREKNTEHCFIFPLMWKSEMKSGSEMFRFRVTCRTTLLYVPALSAAAAHPPLLLFLRDLRNGGHVRDRRVGAPFFLHLSLKQLLPGSSRQPAWVRVYDSVSFSLLLISNVLSVDPQVIRTWQVMSVTRCCVQNSFPWDCSVFRFAS